MDQRFGILDPDAEATSGSTRRSCRRISAAIRAASSTGTIGRKLGIDWYMNQNVTSYTPGTGWATGFIASTVAGALGDTTLNVINATASGTVKVGDIFTVGGTSQQYVITTAATASATVQFVDHLLPRARLGRATGVAITVIATAYVVNLVANKYAIAWASRPLLAHDGRRACVPGTDDRSISASRCDWRSRASTSSKR
jgi:hypothetical protein